MEQTKKARLRLKLLGCPFLEGLEDGVIDELLVVSKGDARLRILKWLLGKAHPLFSNSVNLMATLKTEDGTITSLTECISLLGVCSKTDYDLVKGSSSLAKQVKFIDALTEAVYLSDMLKTSEQYSIDSLSTSSCIFMDSLLANEDIDEVFKSDINLMPADVAYVTGINAEGMKNAKIPSISDLKKLIQEHSEALCGLQSQLDNLTLKEPPNGMCLHGDVNSITLPDSNGSTVTAMQVALSTLIQLIDDFTRCYHDDIAPWINTHDNDDIGSVTSTLGPISKRIHTMLSMVNELLECSSKLEKMHLKWREIIDKEQLCQDSFNGKVTKVFQEFNNTLKEVDN